MATVEALAKQTPKDAAVAGTHILLDHVSWKAYEALLESWADLPRRLQH